jgi:hypothetical protein
MLDEMALSLIFACRAIALAGGDLAKVLRHSFGIRHSCFVIFPASFPDENKDACGQRYNVEQENGRTKVHAEP